MTQSITPAEALERLKEGNIRFIAGVKSIETLATHTQRESLAEKGQKPFAIVLGCADSRAPAELVFDAGLGDLFVVRVAGNIVAPSLLGSIEFAATNFGTPLCIVLGHTRCGAVAATADLVKTKKRAPTDHIHDIVLEIEPSVKLALAGKPQHVDRNLIEEAARMNVAHSMQRLTERSSVLSDLVTAGKLKIIGGVYDLHSGEVNFID